MNRDPIFPCLLGNVFALEGWPEIEATKQVCKHGGIDYDLGRLPKKAVRRHGEPTGLIDSASPERVRYYYPVTARIVRYEICVCGYDCPKVFAEADVCHRQVVQ